MGNRKIIEDQTDQEVAFELAAKAAGKNLTSGDVRFYMELTHLVEKDDDFKISDVAKMVKRIYNRQK